MSDFIEEFENESWDYNRKHYEANVIDAVIDLSAFMGCNSFTLKWMGKSIIIKLEDEPSNA